MTTAPTLTQLDLPPSLGDVAQRHRGLVVVGAADTSLAAHVTSALVAQALAHAPKHVVSIERPIRWDLPAGAGMVVQRELGTDIKDTDDAIAKALRSALRSGAEVVALCELIEPTAIDQALVAAESSALVIASVPARGVVTTLSRLQMLAGPHRRRAVSAAISRCLAAVVSPVRLTTTSGGERWVHDLLVVDDDSRTALAEGEADSVAQRIMTDQSVNVLRLDDQLLRFARAGEITSADAVDAALDPKSLASAIA